MYHAIRCTQRSLDSEKYVFMPYDTLGLYFT
jgi:hypothetical protein